MAASSSSAATTTTAPDNRRAPQAEETQVSVDSAYRTLFRDISRCVVLVQQVGRIDYFCVGSVIYSQGKNTFLMTQSNILYSYSDANLRVCFSDGNPQPATVISRNDLFCVLRTNFHPQCKALEAFEGEIDHTCIAVMAPASSSSVHNIPGLVLQKSIQATDDVPGVLVPEKHFFIISCLYGDTCPSGDSRIISGPVFNMNGKTLGFVFRDLSFRRYPVGPDGDIIHPENYVETGFDMKICLAARHIDEMLGSMIGDVDWRKGLILKSLGERL